MRQGRSMKTGLAAASVWVRFIQSPKGKDLPHRQVQPFRFPFGTGDGEAL